MKPPWKDRLAPWLPPRDKWDWGCPSRWCSWSCSRASSPASFGAWITGGDAMSLLLIILVLFLLFGGGFYGYSRYGGGGFGGGNILWVVVIIIVLLALFGGGGYLFHGRW
jgi:hypothetical protein